MSTIHTVLDILTNDPLYPLSGKQGLPNAPLIHDWEASLNTIVHDIRFSRNLDASGQALANFRSRSHAAMPSSAGLQLWLYRRIYTDACILAALVQLASGDALKAIGSLDSAIIIAGAAGPSRLEIIRDLIQEWQAPFPRTAVPSLPPPAVVTNSLSQHSSPPLASSSREIPKIAAPSLLAFQESHSKHPFIIRGYAQHWPALNDRPWRSASYLRSVGGPGRVVPIEVGNSYLLDSWKQSIMSWDDFLASIDFDDQPAVNSSGEVHYLAQHDLFLQFSDLRNDFDIPDYAYATLTSGGRTHVPPANEDQLVINTWLGPRNTVSPPHTDPYHNVYGT